MESIKWDVAHNRPADVWTPPEDTVARPVDLRYEVIISAPRECDICKHVEHKENPERALYDAKTLAGPWAYMCSEHFIANDGLLGVGHGQVLLVVTA